MSTTEVAGDYLIDLMGRLGVPHDSESVRSVLRRACGGQLGSRRPDGRRASTLTRTGIPFEASVTGGSGRIAPVVRYVTETATQEIAFAPRIDAQRNAIREFAESLSDTDGAVREMFESLVDSVQPEPSTVSMNYRGFAAIGIIHRDSAPSGIAGLKVYCGPLGQPGSLDRLCRRLPGFAGLAVAPGEGELVEPVYATLEVDAEGGVTYKVYMALRRDIAAPMKLVRYFGDAAWEMLSEFVGRGADASALHRYRYVVCRARGRGVSSMTLDALAGRDADLTGLVRELAICHHGSTAAVDALAGAAEYTGASWRYSALGVGISPDSGIDKLNVYCVPTWEAGLDQGRRRLLLQPR